MIAPLLPLALLAIQASAPDRDQAGVESLLRAAIAKTPTRARMESIGTSLRGAPIWCAILSEGDDKNKSGILVIAGANASHRVGVETALGNIQQILERAGSDAATAELLKDHCFYIIPELNPDAAPYLTNKPRSEHPANLRAVDDDRDRRLDEDGADDANGDGFITMMRYPDPKGEYLIDAKDPRIIRKADATKGERGTHKLVIEGIDDDHDGNYNEDGQGGVRLDRNFPHQWKEFDRATGTSAVSEPESRALADFLLNHTNIAAVVVYGLHDNVRKAPRAGDAGGGESDTNDTPGGPGGGGGRGRGARQSGGAAATTILRDDIHIYERAAKLYKELAGAEGDVEETAADGAIHAWSYFQRGLPSFAIRVWTPAVDKAKTNAKDGDATKTDDKDKKEGAASNPASRPAGEREGQGPGRGQRPGRRETPPNSSANKEEEEDRAKAERAKLEWNDKVLHGEGFVNWKAAENPELKLIGAEIGGWKPGVLLNPPDADLAEIKKKHTDFLLALAPECFPKVVIASANFTENKNGLATFKASIRNDGKGQALTAMARRTGTVRPIRVKLMIDGGQIVVGRPQYLVNDLDPQDAPREWTWVLQGKPGTKVTLEVNYPFGPQTVFTGELQ